MLTNYIADKGLVWRVYEEFYDSIIKQTTQLKEKDLNKHFTKDTRMTNKPIRRNSASFIIREMQISDTAIDPGEWL